MRIWFLRKATRAPARKAGALLRPVQNGCVHSLEILGEDERSELAHTHAQIALADLAPGHGHPAAMQARHYGQWKRADGGTALLFALPEQ